MKYLAIAMLCLIPSFVSADEVILVKVKSVPVVKYERVKLLPRRSVHRKVERNGVTFERSVNR